MYMFLINIGWISEWIVDCFQPCRFLSKWNRPSSVSDHKTFNGPKWLRKQFLLSKDCSTMVPRHCSTIWPGRWHAVTISGALSADHQHPRRKTFPFPFLSTRSLETIQSFKKHERKTWRQKQMLHLHMSRSMCWDAKRTNKCYNDTWSVNEKTFLSMYESVDILLIYPLSGFSFFATGPSPTRPSLKPWKKWRVR